MPIVGNHNHLSNFTRSKLVKNEMNSDKSCSDISNTKGERSSLLRNFRRNSDRTKMSSKRLLKDLINRFSKNPTRTTRISAPSRKNNVLGKLHKKTLNATEKQCSVTELQNSFNNDDSVEKSLVEDISFDISSNDIEKEIRTKPCSTLLGDEFSNDISSNDNDKDLEQFEQSINSSKALSLSNSCPLLTSLDADTNWSESKILASINLDDSERVIVEESTVKQLVSYLHHGLQLPRFIGSAEHLEAERMLVLSETKVEVLQSLDYSLNCTCDDFISEITITDMKCHINSAEQNRSANLFYLLILRHHDAVHASKIIKPNKQGLLDFGGSYIFRDTPNTSEIKAELFAIKLNNSIMKGLTRIFAKKSSQTLPLMTFVGEATIGLKNATNGTFFIRFMVENEWKTHLLTATVDIKKDQPALASPSIQNKLQHISPNKGKKN